ncbi:MAG: MurR/RpiR family transcriptional regulator [Culicoidibacterales bacterium]
MNYENILVKINKSSNSLTKKELLVLQSFKRNPAIFVTMSIQELAIHIEVSVATITRFVQKSGFASFSELKHLLKQCHQPKNVTDSALTLLARGYQSLWEQLQISIDSSQTQAVIAALKQYSTIDIIGVASSGYTALELSNRLMRIGFQTRAIDQEHFMIMQASLYTSANLLVAISLSGSTDSIITTMTLAKKRHAYIILLTNHNNSPAAKLADLVIITPRRAGLDKAYSISNQIPQLMYIDFLYDSILVDDPLRQNMYERTLDAILTKNINYKQ